MSTARLGPLEWTRDACLTKLQALQYRIVAGKEPQISSIHPIQKGPQSVTYCRTDIQIYTHPYPLLHRFGRSL